jgi:D-arabinose 1-dehydrogenase-like Zn-dependent alcohol dehydrogenase
MAEKMKGVIISKVGGPWEIVDNIEKPKLGPHQILVKSIVTGINPV